MSIGVKVKSLLDHFSCLVRFSFCFAALQVLFHDRIVLFRGSKQPSTSLGRSTLKFPKEVGCLLETLILFRVLSFNYA
jgi:hypothetical protein